MEQHLRSLDELAAVLEKRTAHLPAAYSAAMEEIGTVVVHDAKAELGTYQPAVGPFNKWSPLAASTLAKKKANTPLYETGKLHDAIEHESSLNHVEVGVRTGKIGIIAQVQELGNSRIPPRPFLGPALYKNADRAAAILTLAIGATFSGKSLRQSIKASPQ